MKGTSTFCVVAALFLVCGCGPSESAKRVRSFTSSDGHALQVIVEKLCASHIPKPEEEEDLMFGILLGDQIPKELAYLKPQSVRIRKNLVDIYLYKTPAAEDSISIRHGQDGVWTIETHEGSWKNEPKVVWSSKKVTNQPSQPAPQTRRG